MPRKSRIDALFNHLHPKQCPSISDFPEHKLADEPHFGMTNAACLQRCALDQERAWLPPNGIHNQKGVLINYLQLGWAVSVTINHYRLRISMKNTPIASFISW